MDNLASVQDRIFCLCWEPNPDYSRSYMYKYSVKHNFYFYLLSKYS
jgi:hypothetical protein